MVIAEHRVGRIGAAALTSAVFLVLAALATIVAAWLRWDVCLSDAAECVRVQDHLYDANAPAEPFAMIPGVNASLAVAFVAATSGLLVWIPVLGVRRRVAVVIGALLMSIGAIQQIGIVVSAGAWGVSSAESTLWNWLNLTYFLGALFGYGIVALAVRERARGLSATRNRLALLLASIAVVESFGRAIVDPLLMMSVTDSYDTGVWTGLPTGILELVIAVLLGVVGARMHK